MNGLITILLDESKWMAMSMTLALAMTTVLLIKAHRAAAPIRNRILAAMSLFFATTVGCMAFGHLLAVSIRLANGSLSGSIPLLYLIGVVLAVPSWWLLRHTQRILIPGDGHRRKTLILTALTGISLLAVGPANLPLAAPAFLNIGYLFHTRRTVGWLVVSVAAILQIGLLVGSLIFMASGQTFEEFRGME